jgi:hypothetical protein
MNDNYESRKFGADKLAFLGMFILSLLIAQLIVSANSLLVFSEPIELAHSGLSVSIPIGKGWQSDEKWRYDGKVFTLSSNFMVERGLPAAAVTCSYLRTSQPVDPKKWFEQQTEIPNAANIETGQIQKGNLTIQWAHIEKPFTIFFGTASLPDNRVVTIEVIQTTFEIDTAEKAFKKIIDRLEYKEDNSVSTGTEIVNEMKNRGIDSLIKNHNKQVCFFIQDAANRNLGFTVDSLGDSSAEEQFRIRGASQLFFAGSDPQEQVTSFRGDNKLNNYIWQSQTHTKAGRADTKIALDESGSINVTSSSRVNSYPNSSTVIPTIFLELVIDSVVQKGIKEAIIDTIDSNGKITPVLISFGPVDSNDEDVSNSVKLAFLNGRGSTELLYLNNENQILREVIQQDNIYKLERTSIESIKEEFPQQAGDILQQNQLFDKNVL